MQIGITKHVTIRHDSIWARVDHADALHIEECLQFKAAYWKQGRFHKERVEYAKNLLVRTGRGRRFYSGLIPRVKQFCDKRGISLETIEDPHPKIEVNKNPRLHGIKFRPDQLHLIHKAIEHKRGVLVAPMRTGKTIVMLGILSMMPTARVLFLCHSKDVIFQTADELKSFGYEDWTIFGAGKTPFPGERIHIATIQSFIKYLEKGVILASGPKIIADYNIILVDEAHHVSKFKGTYASILSAVYAEYKIGVTATPPPIKQKTENAYALEAFIGPIIGKVGYKAGYQLEILAKPKVRLLRTTLNYTIKEIKNWADAYKRGIVNNPERNRLIIDCAKEYINQGKSVLIIVRYVAHGETLHSLAPPGTSLIYGETPDDIRRQAKFALDRKDTKCVICSAVWKEGVNIPSLDVIINAAGGKSEISTLQAVGRGLTRTKDKDKAIIVDFFDPSNYYFISHFGERITLYMDNDWM